MTSDKDFLLDILRDNDWHSTDEILRYSIAERGHGMTVHSRIAELRKDHPIEHRRVKGSRARAHQYRLNLALVEAGGMGEPAAAPPPREPVPPQRTAGLVTSPAPSYFPGS